MSFRSPNMFSLFTLVLASSAVAAVAQAANVEPTKVTKLHTTTDIFHVPCHTADTDMHAWQLTNSFPSPTWSEPSWVLFGAPTATPAASTPPPSGPNANHKELTLDMIVVIVVISTIGGSLILFGLIGCIVKACIHRSGKAASKGKGKGKRKCAADIEMTAGLKAHAAPVEGHSAPRRFEEMDEVSLISREDPEPSGIKTPEPVYCMKWMPYLTGEREWEALIRDGLASKPKSR